MCNNCYFMSVTTDLFIQKSRKMANFFYLLETWDEHIDISPMTNSYNVRNTFLTVNAEICLTVMGFGHMWSYATPRKIIIGRSVISVARVPRGISRFFSFNSLCHSHIISLLLFHFPYLVPVLLYGRYVIIEMSSCRCFDNPITPAFA